MEAGKLVWNRLQPRFSALTFYCFCSTLAGLPAPSTGPIKSECHRVFRLTFDSVSKEAIGRTVDGVRLGDQRRGVRSLVRNSGEGLVFAQLSYLYIIP